MNDYADFANMRADLMRDYNPASAQERLLVYEVASAWRRLERARKHEELFFDLQRHTEAIRAGKPPKEFEKEGIEVLMWVDRPHRAYDQILRAIRDAGIAFDRAIRRIEVVTGSRFRRERLADRDAQANEINAAKVSAIRSRAATAGSKRSKIVEIPPPEKPYSINSLPSDRPDLRRRKRA